jgi:hypothetical protein
LPPPQKTCLSSKAHIGLFVQNFNINVVLYDLINHPNLMGARCSCGQSQTKRGKPPPGQMKNMFFYENLSKLCAEGAIQNLLNMLHFSPEDVNYFGELATSNCLPS